jgi:hypothetical protein
MLCVPHCSALSHHLLSPSSTHSNHCTILHPPSYTSSWCFYHSTSQSVTVQPSQHTPEHHSSHHTMSLLKGTRRKQATEPSSSVSKVALCPTLSQITEPGGEPTVETSCRFAYLGRSGTWTQANLPTLDLDYFIPEVGDGTTGLRSMTDQLTKNCQLLQVERYTMHIEGGLDGQDTIEGTLDEYGILNPLDYDRLLRGHLPARTYKDSVKDIANRGIVVKPYQTQDTVKLSYPPTGNTYYWESQQDTNDAPTSKKPSSGVSSVRSLFSRRPKSQRSSLAGSTPNQDQ